MRSAPPPEIFDIYEAANYLSLTISTVRKYTKERGLPGFKCGNVWRFRRADLEKWVDEQIEIAHATMNAE